MSKKSFTIIAMGLIFGTGGTAHAATIGAESFSYSPMMEETLGVTYNNNIPNSPYPIPTPQQTANISQKNNDLSNAATVVNTSAWLNTSTIPINTNFIPTTYGSNAALDSHLIVGDSTFNTVTGGTVTFFVLGTGAKNVNSLGVYLRNGELATNTIKYTPIVSNATGFGLTGAGMSGSPFQGGQFTAPSGTVGLYLTSKDWRTNFTTTFYSESALNADGYDHLISYALPELAGMSLYITGYKDPYYTFSENGAILIGLKDRAAQLNYDPSHPEYGITLGDDDFNDLMILVDAKSFQPSNKPAIVPEPATFVLVSAGLVGLLVKSRRKRI